MKEPSSETAPFVAGTISQDCVDKKGCSLIDNDWQAAAVQSNLFKLFDSDSEQESEADGFRKLFHAGCK